MPRLVIRQDLPAEAARLARMERQALRDSVRRYNAEGLLSAAELHSACPLRADGFGETGRIPRRCNHLTRALLYGHG